MSYGIVLFTVHSRQAHKIRFFWCATLRTPETGGRSNRCSAIIRQQYHSQVLHNLYKMEDPALYCLLRVVTCHGQNCESSVTVTAADYQAERQPRQRASKNVKPRCHMPHATTDDQRPLRVTRHGLSTFGPQRRRSMIPYLVTLRCTVYGVLGTVRYLAYLTVACTTLYVVEP